MVTGAPAPAAHTDAELTSLLALLTSMRSPVRSVAVGHARDGASRATAQAFLRAWEALDRDVLTVVDWPEEAASWLRPAQRLTAQAPDAWVLAGAPPGVAHLLRRLRRSLGWDPGRTFGFASLADPRMVEFVGVDALDGLRGASADGGTWEIGRN
ncbi:ABC transporter substrate-binding protein [Streptomyces sp. NPDC056352]|uniref:ABC transporter substrate-binding protein n=1 Tax=Streptomyces sp. NPDC056352 TaxID=3345791 RepID=UPI0035DC15DD